MLRHNTFFFLSLILASACTESAEPFLDGGASDVPNADASNAPDAPMDAGPSSQLDGAADASRPSDAAAPDSSVDALPPVVASCDPAPVGGCAEGESQWYWAGSDCTPRRDCVGTGYASLGECRLAHRECEGPGICDALPSFASECEGFVGYAWDGVSCVVGCDYFTTDALIYSTEQECTHFHAQCGEETTSQCGRVLPLGCSTITLASHTLLPLDGPDDCDGRSGDDYDHQLVFVAPDAGTFEVRVQVEGPGPRVGAFVAATRGVCSTRPRDLPATAACLDYDQPMRLPTQPLGVGSTSDRAHTLRVSPNAYPDEYTSLVVCVDRVAE